MDKVQKGLELVQQMLALTVVITDIILIYLTSGLWFIWIIARHFWLKRLKEKSVI